MRYLYSITLLIFLSMQGFGQDSLGLTEAIQLSLQQNYDIQIENKRIDIATNNNAWGEAGRYPSIDLGLGQNNSLTNNIKTASPFQLQDKILNNSISPSIRLNWTVFNGFRVNISKQRLDELQAESHGNASVVIANTIQGVILGYYRCALERERLETLKRQLALSRDKFEYVKIKAEVGSAVSSDMLLEETNYLNDSTNFINQQLNYRNAMRSLNVLLGEPDPQKKWDITDDLTVDIEDYQLQDLYAKMTTKNVDVQKLYISQSIRRYETEMQRANRLPIVSLGAGYSNSLSRVDLSNASFPNADGTSRPGPSDPLSAITGNYFANFTVSFTLFNGGRINRAIQNAVVQEDIASLSVDRMQLSLYRDLAGTLDEYNIRKQIYSINERKVEVAGNNLSIADEKFRNGTINSFDYRIVQNNHLSAALQYLSSLYNLIDSHVGLLRLSGGIIETYNNQ
ncbi:MAG: TolC family protein [Cyclobacteriaceae bacterium]|nr:TolC family protein [Cyclobacteriaceae bacterium]